MPRLCSFRTCTGLSQVCSPQRRPIAPPVASPFDRRPIRTNARPGSHCVTRPANGAILPVPIAANVLSKSVERHRRAKGEISRAQLLLPTAGSDTNKPGRGHDHATPFPKCRVGRPPRQRLQCPSEDLNLLDARGEYIDSIADPSHRHKSLHRHSRNGCRTSGNHEPTLRERQPRTFRNEGPTLQEHRPPFFVAFSSA